MLFNSMLRSVSKSQILCCSGGSTLFNKSSSIYFNNLARSFHSSITQSIETDFNVSEKPTLMKEDFKLSDLDKKPNVTSRERRRRRIISIEKNKREQTGATSLNDEIYNKRPITEFPNRYFALYIPSVVNKTSKVVFHVPMDYTKPEIKEYLETYYGLKIKDVATMITQGRLKRSRKVRGVMEKEPDFKKATVTLYEPVDLGFSDELKIELARNYDKRLNAKLKQAREAAEKMKSEGGLPNESEGSEEEQMKQMEEAHKQMEEAKARARQNKEQAAEAVEVKDK